MKPIKDIIKEEVGAYIHKALKATNTTGRDTDIKPEFNQNFWKWFEGSKVVNPDGSPKLMYHGTIADFGTFEKGVFGFHFGTYQQAKDILTQKRGEYTPIPPEELASGNFSASSHRKTYGKGSSMMLVYLSIKNPIEIQDPGEDDPYQILIGIESHLPQEDAKYLWSLIPNSDGSGYNFREQLDFARKEIIRILLKNGYDGLKYENAYEGLHYSSDHEAWIAFLPEQIKSATGNNGDYSSNNPDITKESMESIEEQLIKELTVLVEGVVADGVADKFAERQFGIPDPNKAMDYQATKAMPEKDTSMGEYIGDIVENTGDWYVDDKYKENFKPEVEARVFANPKTLKDFDYSVRAVSDKDGNLFVADNDGRFFHDELEKVVRESKYGNSSTTYMQWYRQGNSDMFAWSTTYTNFNPLRGEQEQEYIRAIQARNPQFKFLTPKEQMTNEDVDNKENALKYLEYPRRALMTPIVGSASMFGNEYKTGEPFSFKSTGPKTMKFSDGSTATYETIFAYDENGNLAGRTSFDPKGYGIFDIAVKEELRGLGIGTELLKRVEEAGFDIIKSIPMNDFTKEGATLLKSYLDKKINEGVGDKYAERAFNIPDTTKSMSVAAKPYKIMTIFTPEWMGGEHAGKTEMIPVFLNPKSLNGFQDDVRAISDANGNLYVAQLDGNFIHSDMGKELGLTTEESFSSVYHRMKEFQLLHRVGDSNSFGLADSSSNQIRLDSQSKKTGIDLLRKVKAKNPQFDYYPEYYRNVDAYDTDPIDANGNDIYADDSYYNQDEDNIGDDNGLSTKHFKEGVADKYAERMFGIQNQNRDQEVQAVTAMPTKEISSMGEYVGDIKSPWTNKKVSKIFLNPRNLNKFGEDVRALSDDKGNLFVAQYDQHFFHIQLASGVNAMGKYKIENAYDNLTNIQWIRVLNTNTFRIASGYKDFAENEEYADVVNKNLQAVKQKNPQYKYILTWGNKTMENESIEEQLIRELTMLVEGVADKYAERAFNIPDVNKSMEKQAIAGIKDLPPDENKPEDLSKGTLVGEFPVFDHGKYQQVPVYQNPRSLKDFNEDVKAVSNKAGDIFVAQLDLAFYHDDIIGAVKADGIYPQPVYNAYDESENITWHRIGSGDEFGWSISYKRFGYKPENRKYVAMMMQAVMKKNPQYRFIPQYWEETKQQRYDQKHNINNDSLLNYESIVKEELQALNQQHNINNDSQSDLNETTYKVYHGTNEKFNKFDFNKTAQGIVWFTDNIDSIKKGEHGGQGNKYIMTRHIVINNPAGWAEYEKYGLQQLEDMGYDGVILPQGDKTDYFVFSNKSIKK